MKKKISNFSIIGCGKVSGNTNIKSNPFDVNYSRNFKNTFKPLACIDKNVSKANDLKKKYKFKYSSNNLKDISNLNSDIIIISSNTNNHYNILLKISKFSKIPKLVICEKPFTNDFYKAKKILKIYKQKKIQLIINYHRRWDSNIFFIKELIKKKKLGELRFGHVNYFRGVLNNSSHFIDLLFQFFHKVTIYKKGYQTRKIRRKKNIFFTLEANKKPIFFSHFKSLDKLNFEMRLFFSKGVIETFNSGINWQLTLHDNSNKKYNNFKIIKFEKTYHTIRENFLKFVLNYKKNKTIIKNYNRIDLNIHSILRNL